MDNFNKHHTAKERSDIWYTPYEILRPLGPFDLDPCGNATHKIANMIYTNNGLEQKWFGRVWLNPPYSEVGKWLNKMVQHNNGIALVFARVETKWFKENVWKKASALLFCARRIVFCDQHGTPAKANAGAPSVLIAYGEFNKEVLKACRLKGIFVKNWQNKF